MNTTVMYIVSFAVAIICMVASYYVAVNKGRSPVLWVILAFFFSFIPLIIVAVMPAKHATSGAVVPPAV